MQFMQWGDLGFVGICSFQTLRKKLFQISSRYFDRLQADNIDAVHLCWLQHPHTQMLLDKHNVTNISESWAFMENHTVYRGSTAWLRAVQYCNQPWAFFGKVLLYVPECIREPVYMFVAR